jgi:hypothetical protein
MMYRIFAFLVCAAALILPAQLLTGCGSAEPPKKPNATTDPNAPPPPTPEEVAKRVSVELGLDQPLPLPGAKMNAATRATTLDQFRKQNSELSKTPEGQAAKKILEKTLEDKITAYQNGNFWEHVVTYTDAYKIFEPTTRKYESLQQKAMLELRKPKVTLKGLPEVSGQKVAMVSIYVPLTSETFDERLAIGEELHGVKFIGVFGKDRGAKMEYSETGERFVAYLKSQK